MTLQKGVYCHGEAIASTRTCAYVVNRRSAEQQKGNVRQAQPISQ